MKREIGMILSLVLLLGILGFAIVFGTQVGNLSFDLRQQAAGKTHFVENNEQFIEALAKAADADAIFLKVGSYTTNTDTGFVIKNKNIRILGAGKDFVNIAGNNNSHVFTVENASVKFENIKITGANKDGVSIKNTGGKEVSFADVEISNNSGAGINTNTKTIVRASLLDQNGKGIVASSELHVQDTVIQNSAENGITTTGNISVQNSILSNNKGKAIALDGGRTHVIKNVTAVGNNAGIIETGTSTTTITNSIVSDSTKEGISLQGTTSSAQYTNAYNNKGGDFAPAALKSNTTNLSVDSKFTSDTDYHLQAASPLRNKGNTTEKDADGSRIDIGAFGGSPRLSASNAAPTISSTPPRFVKPGETYTYEVKATDPDNDELSYTILNANSPKWITQTNNKFTGKPTAGDIGFAGIVLVVSDKKGHNVVHPISINVIPNNRSVDPVPTTVPTATVAPTTTPTTSNPIVPKITFVTPKAGTVFDGTNRDIKWTLNQGAQVESFVIKYSDDKENFKTITTLKGTDRSYTWDLKDIPAGKYILQIEAQDKGTPPVTIKEISEEFEIKSTTSPTPTTGESIVITKNSPPDNDNVTTKKPLIYVEFKPEADIDETKTYLKINGESVAYKFTKSTVFFEPTQDLAGTKTQVEVKVVTKTGSEATKRWLFSLPTTANPNDTTPTVTEEPTVLGLNKTVGTILLIILIALLVGLILYFVVKLLKTIRDERQGNLEAEFTEYYVHDELNPPAEPQTTQTVTTTQTTVTDNHPQVEFQDQYLASGDQNAEYHIEETTTVQTPPTQPVSYTDVTNNATTQTTETTYAPTDTTTTQTTETTYTPADTAPVDTNAPVAQTTTDYTINDNTVTSNTTTQTTDVDDIGNTTTTTQTTTQTVQSDAYVEELKKKYGITDSDIKNYNDTQANMPDVTPPDPSQASVPPKSNA